MLAVLEVVGPLSGAARLRMVMPQERDQNEHFRTVEEGEGLCSSPTASADRGRSLSCACVRKSRGVVSADLGVEMKF